MKKQILALATLVTIGAQAQEYNKWSIDLNGGVNKPTVGMASGYRTTTPSFWTANAGVRYMFNNKFGLRLAGGYDSFENADNSAKFESNLWNVNLQGVANLGRVLNFETWTKDLGLLAHAGVGYGQLNSDALSKADQVAFLTAGVTPQIRLSNRFTFLLDGSVYFNTRQQNTFDTSAGTDKRGVQGVNFTVTAGLQFALGKHSVHADWFAESSKIDELDQRLTKAEQDLASLNDKLASKADKMVDENNNNIPDELENYLNQKYGNLANANNYATGDAARDLIEKGYINVYFDFNSSNPQKSSLWAADFVANYLKQNPSASVSVVGYADEIGGENYNQSLSERRANIVRQLIIDRGIDASKLTSEGKGEDTSVNKNSKNARQLVRRATFQLK